MMIYFYQNKLFHVYFSKIMQTFYDLTILRGKTLGWIKWEIQENVNRSGYTVCVLLGGQTLLMH